MNWNEVQQFDSTPCLLTKQQPVCLWTICTTLQCHQKNQTNWFLTLAGVTVSPNWNWFQIKCFTYRERCIWVKLIFGCYSKASVAISSCPSKIDSCLQFIIHFLINGTSKLCTIIPYIENRKLHFMKKNLVNERWFLMCHHYFYWIMPIKSLAVSSPTLTSS